MRSALTIVPGLAALAFALATPAAAQDSIVGSYDLAGDRVAGGAHYTGSARIALDGAELVLTTHIDGEARPAARGSATPGASGAWTLRLPAEATVGMSGVLGGLGSGTAQERLVEVRRSADHLAVRISRGGTRLADEQLTPRAGDLAVVAQAPAQPRFVPYRAAGPSTVTVRYEVEPTGAPVVVVVKVTDKDGAEVLRQTLAAQTDAGAGLAFTWDGRRAGAGRPCVDARRSPYRITFEARKDGRTATSAPVEVTAVPLIDGGAVVSRDGPSGDLTAANKIVAFAARPAVCGVVRAIVAGARLEDPGHSERVYFLTDDAAPATNAVLVDGARVALARWDAARWSALDLRWQTIAARPLHSPAYRATQNANRMTRDGEFTNVVSNGDDEGRWLGRDVMEYTHAAAGTGASPTQPTTPGTVRYRFDVDYHDAVLALGTRAPGTPGRKDPSPTTAVTIKSGLLDGLSSDLGGVDSRVHRVSRRGDHTQALLSYIDAYRGVPWLYGSLGNQVQQFIGFDCADLVFGAARHAHLTTRTAFTNAHNFCSIYLKARGTFPVMRFEADGSPVDAKTGAAVKLTVGGTEGVQVGDVVFFDWDADGKWDHTTVMWAAPSGTLDLTAQLVWAHHDATASDGVHVGTLRDLVMHGGRETVRMTVRRF